MAREAEVLAQGASTDHAVVYRRIAEQWLKLADELERPAPGVSA